MHLHGLYKAIKYFGSQQALASAIGVTQQTVSLWLNRDEKIPTLTAFKIFSAVKGLIPLNELLSDAGNMCQLFDSVLFFQKFPQILLPVHEINTSEANCPIYLSRENLVFDLSNEMLMRPTLIDSSHRIITCSCRIHASKLLNNKNILVQIHFPDVIAEKISDDIINFMEVRKTPSLYANGKYHYWIGFIDGTPYCVMMTIKEELGEKREAIKNTYLSKTGSIYSLNFMIGNPAYFGKGLGAKTIKVFIEFFNQQIDPQADTFFIDPDVENPRAKHVYEKAGFEFIADFISEGKWLFFWAKNPFSSKEIEWKTSVRLRKN